VIEGERYFIGLSTGAAIAVPLIVAARVGRMIARRQISSLQPYRSPPRPAE
jgi:hypothetical protein